VGGVVGGIMLTSLLLGLAFFLRKRRKLRLENAALRISVMEPTYYKHTSFLSWMESGREPTYDAEAQIAAAKRGDEPFSNNTTVVVDLNEKMHRGD